MVGLNTIIDLSHNNPDIDFAAAKANGIMAVIHKATQGTGFKDPKYQERMIQAEAAGLLWGSYHFGNGSDPIVQAEFFMNFAGNGLLVLDVESNPTGLSTTIPQARTFVSHVHDVKGVWPVLYGGIYLRQYIGKDPDPILGQCPLWIAEYTIGSLEPLILPQWTTWTLWQYTDGTHGQDPRLVTGLPPVDRDTFNGTEEQLVALFTT